MKVSVIIPVLRDWRGLEQCLDALRKQSLSAHEFEVIVVDNDRQPLPEASRPQGIRYLSCPRGFSYAARNAGISEARGAILAFTDADCVPDPRWLEAGCELLETSGADLVAGRVALFSPRPTLASNYDRVFAFRQDENVRVSTAVTANLLVRRSVVDRIGPFDAALPSGGDYEFTRRAVKSGCRLLYGADAVVGHPTRDTMAQLLTKIFRIKSGAIEMHRSRQPDAIQTLRFLARQLVPRLDQWWQRLRSLPPEADLRHWQIASAVGVRIVLHVAGAGYVLLRLARGRPSRSPPT